MKLRICHGYEYDRNMRLLPKTKKALKLLKEKGCVLFERDDSLQGYTAMQQLVKIALETGVSVFPLNLKWLPEPQGYDDYPYCIALLDDPPCVS